MSRALMHCIVILAVWFGLQCDINLGQSPPLFVSPTNIAEDKQLPTSRVPASPPRLSSSTKQSEQAGVGIALRVERGKAIVNSVVPNTSAARNGVIKPNDQILAIAEQGQQPVEVTGLELTKIVGMIRGPRDTIIRLTILPEGRVEADRLVVSLIRSTFKELNTFVDGRMLAIGTPAPNFKFTRLIDGTDGEEKQLVGQVIVVDFWAGWCQPCLKAVDELETFDSQHPEWKGKVVLLLVSVDDKKEEAVATFKERKWSNTAIVWTGPEILKHFRVGAIPSIYILDQEGKVVAADHHLDVPSRVSSLLQKSPK